MSVLTTFPWYFTPIFRVPGKPVNNPAIIGRWHISKQVTGDASAGNIVIYGYVADLYGVMPKMLFDITSLNVYSSSTFGNCRLNIRPLELSATDIYEEQYLVLAGVADQTWVNGNPNLGKSKYKIGAAGAYISVTFDTNTNLQTYSMRAMGFIYDEEAV